MASVNKLERERERLASLVSGAPRSSVGRKTDHAQTLIELDIASITPDPDQPRKELGEMEGLMASISQYGILQPLVVSFTGYVNGEGAYRLIAGERRFTAARALGLETVPALVRTVEEQERLEIQLVENLQRKDLNPLEEAESYRRLIEEFGLTQEELGRRLGKSQTNINLTLKLLSLPEAVRADYLTSNNQAKEAAKPVSKSLLQEIARQDTEADQIALWRQARRGEMTVKQARAQNARGGKSDAQTPPMAFRYPIQTGLATITLVFAQPKATQEEIVAVLREALETEEARLPLGSR